MITLTNGLLTAKIDTHGAHLRSLTKNGKELLWQGDAENWEGTAPVLFPICSNLKNGVYKYNGKQYSMPSHGFASRIDFEAELLSQNSARFTACHSPQTLEMYPFEFKLEVTFTLEQSSLVTTYSVTNPSNADMYFSIGAHEGYNCPEGIENYEVRFNKTESFDACVLEGNILGYNKDKILPDGKCISLKPDYFTVDAIILEHINSDEVSLVNKTTGDTITVTVGDFPNLLIWTVPGAPFVCLEPWYGFPDYVDTDGDFTKKHSIIKLASGCTDSKTHIIRLPKSGVTVRK